MLLVAAIVIYIYVLFVEQILYITELILINSWKMQNIMRKIEPYSLFYITLVT